MSDWFHALFERSPELALLLSVGFGYMAGRWRWGRWRPGTALGTLFASVVLAQAGVALGDGLHTVLVALFLYAVGFEAAPQAARVLPATGARAAALGAVYALALAVVAVALPRIAGADVPVVPLLAGVVAPLAGPGALAGLAALVHVACALVVCGVGVPLATRRALADDGVAADLALNAGVPLPGPGQTAAAPDLVGRHYRVAAGAASTVAELEGDGEAGGPPPVSVARIRRRGRVVEPSPGLRLAAGDVVLVVGRREAVLARARHLGEEVHGVDGMALAVQRREVVLTRDAYDGRTIGEIRATAAPGLRHGVVVVQLSRAGRPVPLVPDTVVRRHDTVTLHGTQEDVARVAAQIGDPVPPTAHTDLMVLASGLVLGLLLGVPEVDVAGVRLGLGPGGALVAGLAVGLYRARRHGAGAIPGPALRLLKEFGTAALVALVGLGAGPAALAAVRADGVALVGPALLLTLVPLAVALVAGRWLLGFRNGAAFAGALAGTAASAPVLGDVLERTDSPVPVVPFLVASLVAGAGGQWLLYALG